MLGANNIISFQVDSNPKTQKLFTLLVRVELEFGHQWLLWPYAQCHSHMSPSQSLTMVLEA